MTLSVIAEYEFTQKGGTVFKEAHCIAKFEEDADKPGMFYQEYTKSCLWTHDDIENQSYEWAEDYIAVEFADCSEDINLLSLYTTKSNIEYGFYDTRKYITKYI